MVDEISPTMTTMHNNDDGPPGREDKNSGKLCPDDEGDDNAGPTRHHSQHIPPRWATTMVDHHDTKTTATEDQHDAHHGSRNLPSGPLL